MLPLLQYLISLTVWAPAVVHFALKKKVCYDTILQFLWISTALNVIISLKKFWTDCKVNSLFNAFVSLIIGAAIFHFFAIILGAYFFHNYERTASWALWLSSMIGIPLGLTVGTHPQRWFEVILQRRHDGSPAMQRLVCDVYSLIFGSWIGAVVIPLDWNRPWQAWPIPNVIGTATLMFTTGFGFLIKDAIRGGVQEVGKETLARKSKTVLNSEEHTPLSIRSASKSPAKAKAKANPRRSSATLATRSHSTSRSPVKSTAAKRSPSKSPVKTAKATVPAVAPTTPRASGRSRSKVGTPASVRTSSRLRKA